MGLFDAVRSLLGGSGQTTTGSTGRVQGSGDEESKLGPVARSYAETGEPLEPDWAESERDGRVNVLVRVTGEPTPEAPVETDAVEAQIESLGGVVEHAHGGGTVSGWLAPTRLSELAGHAQVERVEVTRPGGDVTEDPDYPG